MKTVAFFIFFTLCSSLFSQELFKHIEGGPYSEVRTKIMNDKFLTELEARFPWPQRFRAALHVEPDSSYGTSVPLYIRQGRLTLMCHAVRNPKTAKLKVLVLVATSQPEFVTLMQGERIIYTEVPEKEHTKFLEGLDIRVAALLFKAAIANDWKPALVPTEEPLFVPWPED
jgi:hypothetical protein